MKRLLPLLLIPLFAGCAGLPQVDANGEIVTPEPPPPPPLPANVRAAMPPGMPDTFVFPLGNGCWAVGIELTEPRSGRPLRDAAGNWVCDEGATPPDLIATAPDAAADPA